ncbi:lipoyltransferase 1, mitochondrial-like [Uloborus diversus]|uniref:lipoyltransferase 1, mitochondrial-like n=1 Tax=Uloborus diversus TaxID=327109 RepID=UPI00240A6DAF|nr:lipoyltransferase 1, mitochondrial-like [Uloborus diversus]
MKSLISHDMVKFTCRMKHFYSLISHRTEMRMLSWFKQQKVKKDLLNINRNTIIISKSRDIYENLAFEDWLYTKCDLTKRDIFILLMWYNGPAVVLGRHQNPWLECSLDFCEASGISIARRNSGGGTVYHDYGNLNCSFFTPRSKYDRKNNLQIICDAIRDHWLLDLHISQRDDILLNEDYKISGTASKLGRTNAYHHCTVLISVDEVKLKQALHRELPKVESKSTQSVRAKVKNLKLLCPDIDISRMIKAVTKEYKKNYNVQCEDIFDLDINEDNCPGLKPIQEKLKSWQWCFGHTPQFTITKSFPLCFSFSQWQLKQLPSELQINLSVKKGVIEDIFLMPQVLELQSFNSLRCSILGSRFVPKLNISFKNATVADEVLLKFIISCIKQMISDLYR